MKHYFNSPVGWLELSATDKVLSRIIFLDKEPGINSDTENPVIKQTVTELTEYFNDERSRFSVPVEPEGSTFQQSVWQELRQIPFGQTTTYGKLAQKLGDPNKVRAVGNANGQNPIPIIIPCHRVIGANNKLIGYGGGIARKRYLLKHEGAILL